MTPLCPELSRYVRREYLRLSLRAIPRETAPTTLGELQAAVSTDRLGRRLIPVWSGASGRTIHASPTENYVFRAWHDACHLDSGWGFSPEEEETLARLCMIRAAEVGLSDWARRVLWAELAGQVQYLVAHGDFPTDQRAFVQAYATVVPVGGKLPLHLGRF